MGQGFFDDRQPQTLLNLGGAVDQPPTFPGDSGIGFAVTTSGSLVRFDLSNPSNGVQIVFAGSQLVAARALPSGQVVVAVLDFGSQQDDESGDGRGRMPWLSIRYPIGDTSPLARFVIGLDEELIKRGTDARCGLMIIDLRSGDIVHWLRVDGMVTELYDVAVLPQVVRPKALGFKTDEIQRTISIGEPGSLV